jgi:hypothetical protein
MVRRCRGQRLGFPVGDLGSGLQDGDPRRRSSTPPGGYATEVIVAYLLLAAPVVAALLFWGVWGWVAAAAVVAAVEYVSLQRSQRFSARVWRSVGMTRRGRRERGIEIVYVISAASGVALLVGSFLGMGGSRG